MPEYGINTRIENEDEMILEKIFIAPIEKVFEMFTDTEHLKHFWAPHGWELIHSTLDFKTGGKWFFGMKNTDGNPEAKKIENWGLSVFEEIEEPNLIVMVDYVTDEKGEINRELPASKTKVEMTKLDDNRTIVVGHKVFNSSEELHQLVNQGLREDIASRWDRLSQYLTTQA